MASHATRSSCSMPIVQTLTARTGPPFATVPVGTAGSIGVDDHCCSVPCHCTSPAALHRRVWQMMQRRGIVPTNVTVRLLLLSFQLLSGGKLLGGHHAFRRWDKMASSGGTDCVILNEGCTRHTVWDFRRASPVKPTLAVGRARHRRGRSLQLLQHRPLWHLIWWRKLGHGGCALSEATIGRARPTVSGPAAWSRAATGGETCPWRRTAARCGSWTCIRCQRQLHACFCCG